jgi:cytochrome P450 family 104
VSRPCENYNGLREPNPHQVFGNGPHHCAGAHLSRRTVGVILLPMLFERFPNMTLPDPASVRWHGFGFRGPLNLPLVLQWAGAREAFSILPHPLP